jgi:hypothetical protein
MMTWTFAKKANHAYPVAVCRQISEKNGAYYVTSRISCHAAKAACDKVYWEFNDLDAQMRAALSGAQSSAP